MWSQTIGQDLQGEQQSKQLPKLTPNCQVLPPRRRLQAIQPFEAETHVSMQFWVLPNLQYNLQPSEHLQGGSPTRHSTSSFRARSSTYKGLRWLRLARDAMSTKHLRQNMPTSTLKCQQRLTYPRLLQRQLKSFRQSSCRVIAVNEIQDRGMLSQAPSKLWRQARLRTENQTKIFTVRHRLCGGRIHNYKMQLRQQHP
jgi:hypothetical protein